MLLRKTLHRLLSSLTNSSLTCRSAGKSRQRLRPVCRAPLQVEGLEERVVLASLRGFNFVEQLGFPGPQITSIASPTAFRDQLDTSWQNMVRGTQLIGGKTLQQEVIDSVQQAAQQQGVGAYNISESFTTLPSSLPPVLFLPRADYSAQLDTSGANPRLAFQYHVGGNTIDFTTTTNSLFGSWADPTFHISYDLTINVNLALPSTLTPTGSSVTATASAVVSGVTVTSPNVLVAIANFFGTNIPQKIYDQFNGHTEDLSGMVDTNLLTFGLRGEALKGFTHLHAGYDGSGNLQLTGQKPNLVVNGGAGDHIVLDSYSDGEVEITAGGQTGWFDAGYLKSITIVTDNGGAYFISTVDIHQTLAGVPTAVQTRGHDFVNLGLNNSVQGLLGAVTITPSLSTSITVDDSADSATHGAITLANQASDANYGVISGLAPQPITYRSAGTFALTVKTGTGSNTVNVQAAGNSGGLFLAGNSASTTVNLGANGRLDNLRTYIVVSNPPSRTTLNINDSNDTANHTARFYTFALLPNTGWIEGLGPNAIEYQYYDTRSVSVQTGTGTNVLNVQDTRVPLSLEGHSDSTSVNIGNAGRVQSIQGPVMITNPLHHIALTVDDSNDTMARTVAMSIASANGNGTIHVSGSADITYTSSDTRWVAVNGGSGGNTFTITETMIIGETDVSAGRGTQNTVNVQATAGPLTVNLQGSADRLNVGSTANTLDTIQGALSITSTSSSNRAVFNDQGSAIGRHVTITDTGLQRSGAAPVSYDGAGSGFSGDCGVDFNGGRGGNTILVQGNPVPGPFQALSPGITGIQVNAGAGSDTIIVSSRGNSFDDLGAVNITGGGGDDTLILHDEGTLGPKAYGFVSWSGDLNAVSRRDTSASPWISDAVINYSGIHHMTFNGGAGGNVFTVDGVPSSTALTLNTGAGSDTVKMRATPAALALDGQAGVNTLDYSQYTGNVYANLKAGTATGASGGIHNIQNLIGGAGTNILVGNGGNVLTGGSGHNLLIAGARASTLIGGSGEDILIAGTTVYDTNADALQAILAEWARTDLGYAVRVSHLRNGGGLNGAAALSARTISGNGGHNTLRGNTGLDLFFAGADTIDADRNLGEVVVSL